jgi:hypothetical protein
MAATPNAARQARFRQEMAARGFVQANCWVPASALPDLQLQAQILRDHPHFSVGPLRDPATGKFVALRSRPTLRICT